MVRSLHDAGGGDVDKPGFAEPWKAGAPDRGLSLIPSIKMEKLQPQPFNLHN